MVPTFGHADATTLHPNPWNPNKMSPGDFEKLKTDMTLFGFIDPVTVRPHPAHKGHWEIIDGENRWRAGQDLGLPIPYLDIGPVTDGTAKKLTIALNELRGQYDPRQMGALLNELLKDESPQQLLEQLPFTDEALAGLVGFEGFDWKGLDKPEPKKDGEKPKSRWVERTFRLPAEANEVLNDALTKAKEDGEDISDAMALEMLAADFLAG